MTRIVQTLVITAVVILLALGGTVYALFAW